MSIDHTIVGNDADGAELRINDSVTIVHPGVNAEHQGRQAVIAAKHKPHAFESLHAPGFSSWVMLDGDCCAPTEALRKVA
tara:strand:- start:42854 stop:43093 length:240 start_codon:yes stop_codon:yes gene_type:complete